METIHIMLVNDDEGEADIIKNLLKEDSDSLLRYHLDVVTDHIEALRAMVRNTHDVYILDQNIPGASISGADFLKRANAGGCSSPVLLLTTYSDLDIEWAVDDCGAAGHLNKYLDLEDRVLKHAIRYAVRHFKRLQEIQEQLSCVLAQIADVGRKLNRR